MNATKTRMTFDEKRETLYSLINAAAQVIENRVGVSGAMARVMAKGLVKETIVKLVDLYRQGDLNYIDQTTETMAEQFGIDRERLSDYIIALSVSNTQKLRDIL